MDINGPNPRPSRARFDQSPDQTPAFVPPDRIAADEDVIDMSDADDSAAPITESKPPRKRGKVSAFFGGLADWWGNRSLFQKILITLSILLLVGAAATGLYLTVLKKPAPKAVTVQKQEVKPEPPKPTTEASQLTGMQVPIGTNQTPVTAIMIENSPDARPQSGLKDAGVVFEAIAEGGITRFLTLFQEAQPDYVGPVRSVRPYYIQWFRGFDASIAHVGGSAVALQILRTQGLKDLDQFFNPAPYWRITQRYAPHNMYTSVPKLLALEHSKGYNTSNFTGFARKAEKPAATPTAKAIDFAISSPLYYAHYDYNATTNSYLRSEGGKPHIDEKSGAQLNPKVVIGLVMPQGIDPDGLHTAYNTIGTGKAYIFQDGTVTVGTWSKDSDTTNFRFGDANGAPLGLNPGQTWLTVVGDSKYVTYVP